MAQLPFAVVPIAFTILGASAGPSANPASHLAEFDTVGMTWKSTATGTHFVQIDLGANPSYDFIAIVRANAQPGTNYSALASSSSTFASGIVGLTPGGGGAVALIDPSIAREDGLYISHLEFTAQTLRYVQIAITGHTGDFEAAMVIVGKRILPANYYSPGWEYGVDDLGSLDLTPNGVVEETYGRIMRTLDFEFGWMAESDFEAQWRPLIEKLGKRRVGYWCFDPTYATTRQAKTYMGWLKTPPAAKVGEVAGRVKLGLTIRSMV